MTTGHHSQMAPSHNYQNTLNSATHHKYNNLFEKNKASTINIKVSQTSGN